MKPIINRLLGFLLLLAAIGNANSQELQSIDKIRVINVTGENINLRKHPNTSAPKLINVCYPETDNCALTWSDDTSIQKGLLKSPWQAQKGMKCLVVDETSDWYGITVCGMKAFISKRFSEEVLTEPITDTMLARVHDFGYENQKPGITNGKYKGYAILCINGYESNGYMVGKIVNGFAVFDKHLNAAIYQSDEVKRLRIEPVENGYYSIAYGKEVAFDWCDGGCYLLDINKLTDLELDKIISLAEVNTDYPTLIYANVGGEIICIAEKYN